MPSDAVLALKALGWGLGAASSFMFGGFIGITVETAPRTRAIFMAFGGGGLMYAAVIEGFGIAVDSDASDHARWVVVGFSFLGALLFVGLEWGLEFVKEKLGLHDPKEEGEEVRDMETDAYWQNGLSGRRALLSLRSRTGSTNTLASSSKRPMLPSVNARLEVELMSSKSSGDAKESSAQHSSKLSESNRASVNTFGTSERHRPWKKTLWSRPHTIRLSKASEEELGELRRGKQASLLFVAASFIDAIPESLVIGMYSNNGDLSELITFVLGVFLSQLPTAMSAAQKMLISGVPPSSIMMMLSSISIWTGVGAVLGSFIFREPGEEVEAAMEGLAGGMLLSLVANTILPEAYAEAGSQGSLVGFCSMLGFLALLCISVSIDINAEPSPSSRILPPSLPPPLHIP